MVIRYSAIGLMIAYDYTVKFCRVRLVGALPEIIDHGKTGFIVHDETEMAEAIRAGDQIL